MTTTLTISAILVALLAVLWLASRRRRRKPIDAALGMLHGLALMVDGSVFSITDPRSGRFVQFYKRSGDGKEACVVFDLPMVEQNEAAFEGAAQHLRQLGFDFRREIDPEESALPTVDVIQIEVEGPPADVAARAFELAKAALAGLGAEQTEYEMELLGEPDQEARARAAKAGLEELGEMRIPILSAGARRVLRDLPETRDTARDTSV